MVWSLLYWNIQSSDYWNKATRIDSFSNPLLFQATGCGSLRSSHPDLPILLHHVHWCMTTLDFLFESWVCKEEKLEPIFMVYNIGQFWNSHTLLFSVKIQIGALQWQIHFWGGAIIFGNHRQGHEMPWNDSRGCPLSPVRLSSILKIHRHPDIHWGNPNMFSPRKSKWNLKIRPLKRKLSFQTSNWFHQLGSIYLYLPEKNWSFGHCSLVKGFFFGIIPRIVAAILICLFRQWVFQIPNTSSKLQSNKPGRRCKTHKKVTNITQERQVNIIMCWLKHPFEKYVSPHFLGGDAKNNKCIKRSIHFVRDVVEEWKGHQPLIWCIPNLSFRCRTKTSKRASRWSFPHPGNLCVNWLVSSCLFATFGKRGRFEGVFFQGGKGFQAFPQIPHNYLILKRTVSFWSRKTETEGF